MAENPRAKCSGFFVGLRSNENDTVLERQFLLRGLFVEIFGKFPRRSWDRVPWGAEPTTARKVEVLCVLVRVGLTRADGH